MSKYQLDKAIRRMIMDDDAHASFMKDPKETVAAWTLTEDEKKALATRDFGALYALGAHPFLLWNWAALVNIEENEKALVEKYLAGIRPHGYPDFST